MAIAECPYSIIAEPFVASARIDTNWSDIVRGGTESPSGLAAYFSVQQPVAAGVSIVGIGDGGGCLPNATTTTTLAHTAEVDLGRLGQWMSRRRAFPELCVRSLCLPCVRGCVYVCLCVGMRMFKFV